MLTTVTTRMQDLWSTKDTLNGPDKVSEHCDELNCCIVQCVKNRVYKSNEKRKPVHHLLSSSYVNTKWLEKGCGDRMSGSKP